MSILIYHMQDTAKVETDSFKPLEANMYLVAMKRLSRKIQDIQTS